jgi:hypothetical protein
MTEKQIKCDTLLVAVVQSQDAEITDNRLGPIVPSVTRLPSIEHFSAGATPPSSSDSAKP